MTPFPAIRLLNIFIDIYSQLCKIWKKLGMGDKFRRKKRR